MKIFDENKFNQTLSNISVSGLQKGWNLMANKTALLKVEKTLNVLDEDFPLPLATVNRATLDANIAWMKSFTAHYKVGLAPHIKTIMCPQVFQRQIKQGAWGITVATMHQVKIAREFGVNRILLANELVGKKDIEYLLHELKSCNDFEFYCLIDSLAQVERLAFYARKADLQKPLNVLIELGIKGRRCGVRNDDEAMAIAKAINEHSPTLALCGIEGYEGAVNSPNEQEKINDVKQFLQRMADLAKTLVTQDLFHQDHVILTAGGSAFFDLVAEQLHALDIGAPTQVILRSGCYALHDAILYENLYQSIVQRNPVAKNLRSLESAMQVWAYVLSVPEPGRAILGLGKRDVSYDAGLPVPVKWYRPGEHKQPQPIETNTKLVEINDQHAMMTMPEDFSLECGDVVVLDHSHPCLTADKWQNLLLIDNDYNVEEVMRTFF